MAGPKIILFPKVYLSSPTHTWDSKLFRSHNSKPKTCIKWPLAAQEIGSIVIKASNFPHKFDPFITILLWSIYFSSTKWPLCARTGPVLGQCCQHRPSIGPVLACLQGSGFMQVSLLHICVDLNSCRHGSSGPDFIKQDQGVSKKCQIGLKPSMLQPHAWHFVTSSLPQNISHVAAILKVSDQFENIQNFAA